MFLPCKNSLQAGSIAYSSEDTETFGEAEEAFLVDRYFLIITVCKNWELSWLYPLSLPSTWHPHVFLTPAQMEIKFLSAVHLRLKPLSAISSLSASKFICSFSLPSEKNKINVLIPDICLMLTESTRAILYLPEQLLLAKVEWKSSFPISYYSHFLNCKPKQCTKQIDSSFLVTGTNCPCDQL